MAPTSSPSALPSFAPSESPSSAPSELPSLEPSESPSLAPSALPSFAPSKSPSFAPSEAPSDSCPPSPQVGEDEFYFVGNNHHTGKEKTKSCEWLGKQGDIRRIKICDWPMATLNFSKTKLCKAENENGEVIFVKDQCVSQCN